MRRSDEQDLMNEILTNNARAIKALVNRFGGEVELTPGELADTDNYNSPITIGKDGTIGIRLDPKPERDDAEHCPRCGGWIQSLNMEMKQYPSDDGRGGIRFMEERFYHVAPCGDRLSKDEHDQLLRLAVSGE